MYCKLYPANHLATHFGLVPFRIVMVGAGLITMACGDARLGF